MPIKQISLTNFRSLKNTNLSFHPQFNIITGNNGAGKSSLLEAIHLVSQGKSFSTNSLNEAISHGCDQSIVFARFDKHTVGFKREKGKSTIKVDGSSIDRLSDLVALSPVRCLNHNSFNLAISKPNIKREFLDWLLFHVEPDYKNLWVEYRALLKQRNAALKDKNYLKLLGSIDSLFVSVSLKIKKLRQNLSSELNTCLNADTLTLLRDLSPEISYVPGWEQSQSLGEIFQRFRERERRYGYTLYGIQRDNLTLTSNKHGVNSILSRGQIKRFSVGLYVAQILTFMDLKDQQIILLIDDLTSELDKNSISFVLDSLKNLAVQVFISSISIDELGEHLPEDYNLFHVEHGIIRQV